MIGRAAEISRVEALIADDRPHRVTVGDGLWAQLLVELHVTAVID